jgi:hypothetical protein
MLYREAPDAVIAISQPSHAWLSGQIIRAWGNEAFGSVTPYEDVCLGAEQHDIGWLPWEQAPTFNSATGRPHSFRELGVAAHTEIWRRGAEMALAFGRYPALLVSLHGCGLYERFDSVSANAADVAVVRDFLGGQRAIQLRSRESLSADPRFADYADHGTIERNRGLVRAADRMSIAICTGMRDIAICTEDPHEAIVRQVPTAGGDVDVRLAAVGGDLTNITVTPWPFAGASVGVTCEGILLPAEPFQDESAMRAALGSGPRQAIVAELRPE